MATTKLPEGWHQAVAEDGNTYYYNEITGTIEPLLEPFKA
jgi:hypothetical protein